MERGAFLALGADQWAQVEALHAADDQKGLLKWMKAEADKALGTDHWCELDDATEGLYHALGLVNLTTPGGDAVPAGDYPAAQILFHGVEICADKTKYVCSYAPVDHFPTLGQALGGVDGDGLAALYKDACAQTGEAFDADYAAFLWHYFAEMRNFLGRVQGQGQRPIFIFTK